MPFAVAHYVSFRFFLVPASHALVHVWCRIIVVEASVSFVTAALCSAKGTILHRRPSDSVTNKLRFHMCDIRECYPRFRLLPISMKVCIRLYHQLSLPETIVSIYRNALLRFVSADDSIFKLAKYRHRRAFSITRQIGN